MSSPEKKSFATTAASAAAFPILAGHLIAGFSELARLNLSMYAAVLAGVENKHESTLPSRTPEPLACDWTGRLPPFAAQFVAPTSAAIDMTLRTLTALNRLAFDGYVETVRHTTATIAAMASSFRIADAMTKVNPAPDVSGCAVAAIPPAAPQDIAHKAADSAVGAAPTARRRRSPSR